MEIENILRYPHAIVKSENSLFFNQYLSMLIKNSCCQRHEICSAISTYNNKSKMNHLKLETGIFSINNFLYYASAIKNHIGSKYRSRMMHGRW